MSKSCCVCGESKENPDNRLFTCKGHGCDVTVHQGELNCDMKAKKGDMNETTPIFSKLKFC